MDTTLFDETSRVRTPLTVLAGPDPTFSKNLDALRAELAPVGMVEGVMVDRIVLAASRLRAAIACDGDPDSADERISRAEQSFDRALAALNASRASRAEGWGRAASGSSKANDLPMPFPAAVTPEPAPAARPASGVQAEGGNWRDRLVFDEHVSDESPVVRGTWITAGRVVSMVVDGMTWDDILRRYPELTERDIRACVCFTEEQDGPISL
ncbi:DUF433 domain-containing protein [Tautonia plasticadhaerens]|nr:DUF433 domain-containing protein [Tautonia plasticadhaerens]